VALPSFPTRRSSDLLLAPAHWFLGRNDPPEASAPSPLTEHPPASSRASRDCPPESGKSLRRFLQTRFFPLFLSIGLLATFLPEPCNLPKARSSRRWSLRCSYLHSLDLGVHQTS